MAIYYQTEYRLGNRGRICRSYTGFQAFLAIFFDLIFGLFFEVVSAAISLAFRLVLLAVHLMIRLIQVNWKILVAAMTLIVYIVTLPFALLHEAVDRLRSPREPEPTDAPSPRPASPLKTSWALSREV
jgi:hypothetical protein